MSHIYMRHDSKPPPSDTYTKPPSSHTYTKPPPSDTYTLNYTRDMTVVTVFLFIFFSSRLTFAWATRDRPRLSIVRCWIFQQLLFFTVAIVGKSNNEKRESDVFLHGGHATVKGIQKLRLRERVTVARPNNEKRESVFFWTSHGQTL